MNHKPFKIYTMGLFDNIIEQRIKEAIRNGDFENLEGEGKPIDNSDYFNAPADKRMLFHILKNAKVLPEELRLRKEMASLEIQILDCHIPKTKALLQAKYYKLQTAYNIMIEKQE